jgi:hypothetical protein
MPGRVSSPRCRRAFHGLPLRPTRPGDSGDTPTYAVEREIEDLEALVNEAGGSAFAFGMSSGAVLVLDAAAHGVALRMLAPTSRRSTSTTAVLRCRATTWPS